MKLPSRTTVAVAAVLLASVAGGLAWQVYQARPPDVHRVGGTVLVYQLDPRAAARAAAVAEALGRRFAAGGLGHVTAGPGDAGQVEVRIPRVGDVGDHLADVQSVKEMVARVGRLAFRIVANDEDDREAIAAARRMANDERADDAKLEREFADAQRDGLPPPGPRDADGRPRTFRLALARGTASTVSYRWLELGEPERRSLHLEPAAGNDPTRDAAWKKAAVHRDRAVTLPEGAEAAAAPGAAGAAGAPAGRLLDGALFYSRECQDRHLTDAERVAKAVDFFVLTRDPELDPATGKPTPDVDGSQLASVYAEPGADGRLFIVFRMTPAGGELLGTLTRKNVAGPGDPPTRRHLAIVLDDRVMSSPAINSEIRERGSITGAFTDRQVRELVGTLRAGTLPAALLPRPVRETKLDPGAGR